MINFSDLDNFAKDLERVVDEIENEFSTIYSRWCYLLARALVTTSPQWSGSFAANWQLSIGVPSYEYTEVDYRTRVEGKLVPLEMGDQLAVTHAMSKILPVVARAKIKDTVYITNSTPYAKRIAANQSDTGKSPYLRERNYFDPAPIPLGYVMQQERELLNDAGTMVP